MCETTGNPAIWTQTVRLSSLPVHADGLATVLYITYFFWVAFGKDGRAGQQRTLLFQPGEKCPVNGMFAQFHFSDFDS